MTTPTLAKKNYVNAPLPAGAPCACPVCAEYLREAEDSIAVLERALPLFPHEEQPAVEETIRKAKKRLALKYHLAVSPGAPR